MIISLTSIPSRFKYLPMICNTLGIQGDYSIWVNIPWKYNRFPDQDVVVPELRGNVVLNRCNDYGPATKYIGPIEGGCTDDVMVIVDDDTAYPPNLCKYLNFLHEGDNSAWCTSGFRVNDYISGNGRVPRYDKQNIDVTEGYGGVLVRTEWMKKVFDEYLEWKNITYNDDIIVSSILAKYNISRKSVCDTVLNIGHIRQYNYGMDGDALFQNDGEGSHVPNNKRVFQTLKDKGMYYYNHS